jgi:putative oxidoreductase
MTTQTRMDRYLTEFFRNRAEGQFALVSTVIRVLSGLVFAYYGITKLTGLSWTTSQFRVMGFPDTAVIPFLVGLLEFVGGLMLVAGLGTRLAAGLLGLEMVGACAATLGIMDGRPWFLLQPLLMLALMAFLLWSGPSRYALDDRFQAWLRRTLPGHFGIPALPAADDSTGPIPVEQTETSVFPAQTSAETSPQTSPETSEPQPPPPRSAGSVPDQPLHRAPGRPTAPGGRTIGRQPRLPGDGQPPQAQRRQSVGRPPEHFADRTPQPPEPRRPPGQSRHGR